MAKRRDPHEAEEARRLAVSKKPTKAKVKKPAAKVKAKVKPKVKKPAAKVKAKVKKPAAKPKPTKAKKPAAKATKKPATRTKKPAAKATKKPATRTKKPAAKAKPTNAEKPAKKPAKKPAAKAKVTKTKKPAVPPPTPAILRSEYLPDAAMIDALGNSHGSAESDPRDDGADVTIWLLKGADLIDLFTSLGSLELDHVWWVRIGLLIRGEGPGEQDQYHKRANFWGKEAYTRWIPLAEYGPALSAFDGPGGLRDRNESTDVLSWIVDIGTAEDGGEPHR